MSRLLILLALCGVAAMPPSPPAPKHRHAVVSPTQGSGAASLIIKAIVPPPPKVKTNTTTLSWDQPTNDTINKLFVSWNSSRQQMETQYTEIQSSTNLRQWSAAAITNRPPVRLRTVSPRMFWRARWFMQ